MPAAVDLLSFLLFVTVALLLPGAFLVSVFFRSVKEPPAQEALAAAALFTGTCAHSALWLAMRYAGFGYGAVAATHLFGLAVLAAFSLGNPAARNLARKALGGFFSGDIAAFGLLAALAAAYLTYGDIRAYYTDELFRLSIAASAKTGLPLQNMLVHAGTMKYYFLAEFFSASISAVGGVPLERVYFRYMVPLCWIMLFVGMRGLAAQADRGFSRSAVILTFLLLFLVPPKMLYNFVFRQNAFSLGLAALAISTLSTALSTGSGRLLAFAAAAPAILTLTKANCGALALVVFCSAAALSVRERIIGWRRGAAAALLAAGAWYLSYNALLGQGFQAGSVLRTGVGVGWLKEFLPEYVLNADILRLVSAGTGIPAAFLAMAGETLENGASLLIVSALPLAALLFMALRKEFPIGVPRVILSSALAAYLAGSVLFLFVHFENGGGSHPYWAFFGAWILSITAFPLLLARLPPAETVRSALPLLLVPLADFVVSFALRTGAFSRLTGALGSVPPGAAALLAAGPPVLASGLWLYSRSRARSARAGWPAPVVFARAAFVCGLAAFAVVSCRIFTGELRHLLLYATWLPALAALPLFLESSGAKGRRGFAAAVLMLPLLVAVSHAPKYIYWAAGAKAANWEPWAAYNDEGCSAVNASLRHDDIYLHNMLGRSAFTQAAFCRARMYASYYERGAWEDPALYAHALRDAKEFFAGRVLRPCEWLKERGVRMIYLDDSGSEYDGAALGAMGFLEKVYGRGNVSVFSVGDCARLRVNP